MRIRTLIKKMTRLNKTHIYKMRYYKYYKKNKVNENIIYLESQQGRTLNGSMFYILKELTQNKEYSNFEVYTSIKKDELEKANILIKENNIKNVNVIITGEKKYYEILSSAKYLITDTSFLPFFIKKQGQEILNIWHGTPWKCLGKKSKNDYHLIGNVQKNFNIANYLLYQNEFMRDHMIEDYMLENLSKAKIMLAGYPRNTAFFDNNRGKEIREILNIEDKKIIAYMPTWRESKDEKERIKNNNYLLHYLFEIDKNLDENQILYVNLHPLAKNDIDFSLFKNIKTFPEEFETYEFLNIVDCLITDYSSVFFDFAITRKKIILFNYDEEEYLKGRGLYFDISALPFTKVKNVKDLIIEINTEKQYDDTEFINKFCKYDRANITKEICEKFIFNRKNSIIEEKMPNNNKENVIFYVGNLAKNGITSSIRNLLNNIDLDEKNYYITFSANKIRNNKEQLFTFPKKVNYISTVGNTNMTLLQKIAMLLFENEICPIGIYNFIMKSVYEDEIKRLYGDCKIDAVVQFSGYEHKKIILYSKFDCKKIIYVHSDMLNEIRTRKNQNKKALKIAYNTYDKVAVVNKELTEATAKISGRTDNIMEAKNLIPYKNILKKSELPIEFDESTESNVDFDKIIEILNSNSKKIISIGRFSPEKGHSRLINAFEKNWKENNDIYLVIIGGAGKEYEETVNYVKSLECGNNIILIKSISNPYAILKKCDYFVLSSFYEGFGIVIAEADILNKPIISTDIVGPRSFIIENGGCLVPNNEQGIYVGIKKLLNSEIKPLNVDYEKYNQEAVQEFYNLFK